MLSYRGDNRFAVMVGKWKEMWHRGAGGASKPCLPIRGRREDSELEGSSRREGRRGQVGEGQKGGRWERDRRGHGGVDEAEGAGGQGGFGMVIAVQGLVGMMMMVMRNGPRIVTDSD